MVETDFSGNFANEENCKDNDIIEIKSEGNYEDKKNQEGKPYRIFNIDIKNGEKNLDEKTFRKYLWTQDLPDPDLIIRTSGEKRLSGFLPWQGVYSELFFTKTYWPALSRNEFFGILKEFGDRERRMGR